MIRKVSTLSILSAISAESRYIKEAIKGTLRRKLLNVNKPSKKLG